MIVLRHLSDSMNALHYGKGNDYKEIYWSDYSHNTWNNGRVYCGVMVYGYSSYVFVILVLELNGFPDVLLA